MFNSEYKLHWLLFIASVVNSTEMTELQKLGIQRILELAKDTGNFAIETTANLMSGKTEFNADKHTYPISQKAREIEWWASAIMDDADDE